MAIVDGNGLPVAGRTESASPAEVTLVEDTLEYLWVPGYPKRLIGYHLKIPTPVFTGLLLEEKRGALHWQ